MSRVEKLLAALLVCFYAYSYDTNPGPNVFAHVDQAISVVAEGTLAIDLFVREGGRYTNTVDWARAPDGHFYPAKAPGTALVSVPLAFVLYHAEKEAGLNPLSAPWMVRNAAVLNLLLNAIPSALMAVVLLRLCVALGAPLPAALLATVAFGLGTPYHVYATSYYAHNFCAMAVIAAAWLAWGAAPGRRTALLAGFFAGWAVLFDYTAAVVVACLGTAFLALRRRDTLAFVAGGLVPLAILLSYQQAVFGSPFATPYAYQNPRFTAEDGSFLAWPDLAILAQLVLLPKRGILLFAPVLGLAFLGATRAWRAERRLAVFAAAALGTFAAWLLINSGYRTWWGGWTACPRFIIPALPMLVPLVALSISRLPWPVPAGLAALSVANHAAIALVGVLMSDAVAVPLRAAYANLWRGTTTRGNLGLLVGLEGWAAAAPLVLAAGLLGVLLQRAVAASGAGSRSVADERALQG